MRKKKLKQRIAKLESELRTAKSSKELWESTAFRFVDDLKGYGVKTEIIRAEPPIIDISQMEDDKPKYTQGINTAPSTLVFDFSEHDKKIIVKHAAETCEKWRKIWRDMERYE